MSVLNITQPNPWGDLGAGLGAGLGQGIAQGAEGAMLEKVLGSITPDMTIQQALAKIYGAPTSPEVKKSLADVYATTAVKAAKDVKRKDLITPKGGVESNGAGQSGKNSTTPGNVELPYPPEVIQEAVANGLIDEAKVMQGQNEAALKHAEHREKIDMEINKPDREYYEQLQKDYHTSLERQPLFTALGSGKTLPLVQLRKYFQETYDLPAGVTLSDSEQVIDKFASQAIRYTSSYYPGAIRVAELQNEVRSNPSLLNTDEGRARVAKANLLMDQLKIEEAKIAQKLRKENGGQVPDDLRAKILEEMPPVIDRITNEALRVVRGEDKMLPQAKPGQKITEKQAEFLLDKYNGDKQKAREEAKRLGYAG